MADLELATSERAALVELFAGLDDGQWAVPSLCPGWTVKHVLAHLASVLDGGPLLTMQAALRGLGRPPAIIEVLTRAYVDRSPADLVATYGRHADSTYAPPILGWRASLSDVMVHRLDVAVPLGIDAVRPPEPWGPVLDFLTSRIPTMGSIRSGRPKVAWRATDLDWHSGTGPEVAGPAEAVGMAVAGRSALLDRLHGPGVPLVRDWLCG